MAYVATKPAAKIEIITYAPTEFYHCQHCEIVWNHLDFGQKLHAEQRAQQLPADLLAEYTAISDWVQTAFQRYDERLTIKVVDAVSIEGFIKSLRYRSRHFPLFVVDSTERIQGFDPAELDRALEQRLGLGAAA
ncbi:MAG TPA: hypothetical protein VGK54_19430 [Chloroflexota bacterium]|jgi:hypothetical protein